jgi:hypothetical protein
MGFLKTISNAALWSVTFIAILSMTTIVFFFQGPKVETLLFPVFSNVHATALKYDREGDVIHVAASGSKDRLCSWKGITAMVLRDGTWHQGGVYFADPRKGGTPKLPPSRSLGQQSLGEIWIFPAGDKVRVYLYHECHPLWQTTTFLYELDLLTGIQTR